MIQFNWSKKEAATFVLSIVVFFTAAKLLDPYFHDPRFIVVMLALLTYGFVTAALYCIAGRYSKDESRKGDQ